MFALQYLCFNQLSNLHTSLATAAGVSLKTAATVSIDLVTTQSAI